MCSSRSRHSTSAEDFPDSEPPPLPPPKRRALLSASRLPGNLTRSEFLLLRQLATQTRKFRNPFSDEGNVLHDEDIVCFIFYSYFLCLIFRLIFLVRKIQKEDLEQFQKADPVDQY